MTTEEGDEVGKREAKWGGKGEVGAHAGITLLPRHLRAIKDYFLLARGDLFQAFIDNTRGLLALPETPENTIRT